MRVLKIFFFNLNYNSIWNATGQLVVLNKKLNQNSFKSLWYYVINDFRTAHGHAFKFLKSYRDDLLLCNENSYY